MDVQGEKTFFEELKATRARLHTIWDEVGFTEAEKNEKIEEITSAVKGYLKKLEERQVRFRNTLVKEIEEAGLELFNLTNALNIPNCEYLEVNLSMLQLVQFLEEKVKFYQREVDERLALLNNLKEQEIDLCNKLGEETTKLPSERVPSQETLQLLERVVASLKLEKAHRERAFRSLRASILAHMEELYITPSTSFERTVLLDMEDFVVLSQHNIQKMKTMSGDLQIKVQQQKEKEENLRGKIQVLFDRLSVNNEQREIFFNTLSESSKDNIIKLEEELKKLNELKTQNMGCFINRLRRDLEDWWEKCYISEDEKENFLPYDSEEYTEEILEAHENEVQRLQDFFTRNEEIFLKIKKWQVLWRKAMELEDKINDPARLFGNRGCALLQEERERKRVRKELPKLELIIEHMMEKCEKENGHPFLVCGQTLSNFIKSQWEEHNERKNREKQIKHLERKKLQMEACNGTKTLQRKRLLRAESSETLRTSKFLRSNSNERTPIAGCSSMFARSSSNNCNFAKTSRLRSGSHSSQTQAPLLGASKQVSFNSSEMSSYDKFTKDIHRLSERENVRSSVIPRALNSRHSPRNIGIKGSSQTSSGTPKTSRFVNSTVTRMRQPLTPTGNQMSNRVPTHTLRAPSTLPRRSSARINAFRSHFLVSRNVTVSPGVHSSQRSGLGTPQMSTPIRNRLDFLM